MIKIKLILLIFFITVFTFTGFTQTNIKQTMNTKTENMDTNLKFINLYNEMYEFMINKDVLSLGKMLDDNFVLVHMTGLKQNKKEYLTYIKNGTLNYFSNQTENIIIETDSKFVGQSKVSAAVFGGGKHTWNLELTIELTENDLIKKIVASTY